MRRTGADESHRFRRKRATREARPIRRSGIVSPFGRARQQLRKGRDAVRHGRVPAVRVEQDRGHTRRGRAGVIVVHVVPYE